MWSDGPGPGAWIDPACPVERAHPLNRGLVGWWMTPPNSGWRGGLTMRDLVRGGRNPHDGTLTSGPTWAGPLGRPGAYGSVLLDGTNDYVSLPLAAFSPLVNFTLSMWIRPTAALGGADICYWSAVGDRMRLRTAFATYDGLSGVIQIAGGQTTINVASGVGGAVGKWTNLALTYDGATFSVWANGRVVGTPASVTGSLDWSSFSDGLATWGIRTGLTLPFNGSVDDMRLYNWGLTAGPMAALYSQSRRGHPDTLRWVSRRAMSVPQAGGTNNYTLTAAAGSYTLTGKAANLLTGRKLTAVAGSYTLTGVAASLKTARSLTAGTGFYTLTGVAANLSRTTILTAATGSYTLTGRTANLPVGRVLGAGTGAYTLTGKAATLTYIPANAYVLTAALGSYSLTGRAVNLLPGRKVTADTGGYTLTGKAASLTYQPVGSYTLTCLTGSYTLTGKAANLLTGRRVTASPGSFLLTGQPALLRRGLSLTGLPGAYTLAGQPSGLLRGRLLLASPGSLLLTGKAATLAYSGVIIPVAPTLLAILDYDHLRSFTLDF